jgi:hypothetical protein
MSESDFFLLLWGFAFVTFIAGFVIGIAFSECNIKIRPPVDLIDPPKYVQRELDKLI